MTQLFTVMIGTVVYFCLLALMVAVGWNHSLVPVLHLPEITFTQSCWLVFLVQSLFNTREGLKVAQGNKPE